MSTPSTYNDKINRQYAYTAASIPAKGEPPFEQIVETVETISREINESNVREAGRLNGRKVDRGITACYGIGAAAIFACLVGIIVVAKADSIGIPKQFADMGVYACVGLGVGGSTGLIITMVADRIIQKKREKSEANRDNTQPLLIEEVRK